MSESGSPQSSQAPVADRYRLLHRLGTGASGEVFEAEDLHTGGRLAVKLLFPHVVRHQPNQFRFDRQWELLQEIEHPNIVRLHDAGWCDHRQTQFAAMERLEGVTFSEHLGPLATPIAQLMDWVRDALAGLGQAHAAGLVHRDLKPDNLFVRNEEPRLKVIDFGLVRAVDVTGPTQTQMGLGTPSYMAPEQATSARSVTQAADVWSMGVLLYRVLSGRVPFVGEGPYEIMIKVMTTPHAPLDGVPAPLAQLVDRCLAKHPEDRPQDARALAGQLDQALRDPAVAAFLAEAGPSRARSSDGVELPPQMGGGGGLPAVLPDVGTAPAAVFDPLRTEQIPGEEPTGASAPLILGSSEQAISRPPRRRWGAVAALAAAVVALLGFGLWGGLQPAGSGTEVRALPVVPTPGAGTGEPSADPDLDPDPGQAAGSADVSAEPPSPALEPPAPARDEAASVRPNPPSSESSKKTRAPRNRDRSKTPKAANRSQPSPHPARPSSPGPAGPAREEDKDPDVRKAAAPVHDGDEAVAESKPAAEPERGPQTPEPDPTSEAESGVEPESETQARSEPKPDSEPEDPKANKEKKPRPSDFVTF